MSTYLLLMHGRTTPDEQLSDWGIHGPVFKVAWVHLTYLRTVRIGIGSQYHATIHEFEVFEDLIYYDGVYYGDMEVLHLNVLSNTVDEWKATGRLQKFDDEKAELPEGMRSMLPREQLKDLIRNSQIPRTMPILETRSIQV